MLTNLTPGFYWMRNRRLACVPFVDDDFCSGFAQCINYKTFPGTWSNTGEFTPGEESQYDLVEKIE